VKKSRNAFSNPAIIRTILLPSHAYGLNKPALIAGKKSGKIPAAVPSKSPISKLEPP
jgi:hypothetical protein